MQLSQYSHIVVLTGPQTLEEARPTPTHLALAELERKVLAREGRFTLFTESVDGLHQLAGNRSIVELCGSEHRLRCPGCEARGLGPRRCPSCGTPRVADVWPADAAIPAELAECDLLILWGGELASRYREAAHGAAVLDDASLLPTSAPIYACACVIADSKRRNDVLGFPRQEQDRREAAELANGLGLSGPLGYADDFVFVTFELPLLQAFANRFAREDLVHFGYHCEARLRDQRNAATLTAPFRLWRGVRCLYREGPLTYAEVKSLLAECGRGPVGRAIGVRELPVVRAHWSSMVGAYPAVTCPLCARPHFEWEEGDGSYYGAEGTCLDCGAFIKLRDSWQSGDAT